MYIMTSLLHCITSSHQWGIRQRPRHHLSMRSTILPTFIACVILCSAAEAAKFSVTGPILTVTLKEPEPSRMCYGLYPVMIHHCPIGCLHLSRVERLWGTVTTIRKLYHPTLKPMPPLPMMLENCRYSQLMKWDPKRLV